MIDDPIVEQVRQARQRIYAECGNDLDHLIARLKSADSENKDHVVTIEEVRKRSRTPKAAT